MKGKSAEDEKTNQKKTRKSAKNKRNMESAQTSIADIIDWESKRSTKGNTTVLYDSLPELTTEQIPNKPGQATREVNSQGASDDLALTSTQTLNSFFDSMSLLSVGEDEAFSFEWIRLKTFSDWPLKSIFSTTLAKNGWVSLGEGDRARCYSCHVVHEGWRIGDDPDQYHSPNCRFKKGLSNNIPISRATKEEPQQRLGIAKQGAFLPKGAGELSTAEKKENHQQRQQVATTTTSAEISTHTKEALNREPSGINVDRPRYPSYADLAVRISSYTDWPADMTQTPHDLALAGFFYVGNDDYTRCFFCGGGLRNWEASDDPWFEHARWFKECAFVQQNREQEFIDLVQKRLAESDSQRNQEEKRNLQTNTIARQNSTHISNQSDSVVENAAHQMRQSDPVRERNLHTIKEDNSDNDKMESNAELNALKEENMNLRNQQTCKICMEERVAIGLSPCGHLACCEACAPTVKECPVCQENVTHFFKAMLVRQKNRQF